MGIHIPISISWSVFLFLLTTFRTDASTPTSQSCLKALAQEVADHTGEFREAGSHGSGSPVIPRTTWNERTGEVRLDFSPYQAAWNHFLKENPKFKKQGPFRHRIVIDSDPHKTHAVSLKRNQHSLHLLPENQHHLEIETLNAQGKVLRRTNPILLEIAHPSHVLSAEAFEGYPVLENPIPPSWEKLLGPDAHLTRITDKIQKSRYVVLPKNYTKTGDFWIPPQHRLVGKIDAEGNLIQLGFQHRKTGKKTILNPNDYRVIHDAAFNGNSFLWDAMFAALGDILSNPRAVLDALLHWAENIPRRNDTDAWPREVLKSNGRSFVRPSTLFDGIQLPNGDYLNPNIAADVLTLLHHLQPQLVTSEHLATIAQALEKYWAWVRRHRSVYDEKGNWVGTWMSNLGSGRDNAPRFGTNAHPEKFPQSAAVDQLAQEIASKKSLARIYRILRQEKHAQTFDQEVNKLEELLNTRYWDEKRGFYYDLVKNPKTGKMIPDPAHSTAASFWPLYAGSVSAERSERIVQEQLRSGRYGGDRGIPSIPEDHPLYKHDGNYWQGAEWAPDQIMAIIGLATSGRLKEAVSLAFKNVRDYNRLSLAQKASFGRETVYENIARDENMAPIVGVFGKHVTRPDFVGWSGAIPRYIQLRYVTGLEPLSAPATSGGALEWRLYQALKVGESHVVQGYHLHGQVLDLQLKRLGSKEYALTVKSERPVQFHLSRYHIGEELNLDHVTETAQSSSRTVSIGSPRGTTVKLQL